MSESYKQAVSFLASRVYVCEDSIELMAELFGTPIAVVRWDIQQARGKK